MKFYTSPVRTRPSPSSPRGVYLVDDMWDDFNYKTLWHLYYVDGKGVHDIGGVKIGDFEDRLLPTIPDAFDKLSDAFFSLGVDEDYYENLNGLGKHVRTRILSALHDVAVDLALFQRAQKVDVTQTSLLRFVSPLAVQTQLHRMALGGVRLSPYSFTYHSPDVDRFGQDTEPQRFDFSVDPEAHPRTNVHVLIGRNGVGKSFMLNDITTALTRPGTSAGRLEFDQRGAQLTTRFANVVSVAYSAFDSFEPMRRQSQDEDAIRYHYIGLKKIDSGENSAPKGPTALAREFSSSLRRLVENGRRERWERTLAFLDSDPIFGEAMEDLFAHDDEALRDEARLLFSELSSGHKIVLLTLTRLVETIEEATLVLIDEPEAHLHPPLLAAFVSAVSELLEARNAVALIATHSPVIVQEVPSDCVYKLWRSGGLLTAERPSVETYGENVGTLTQDIFGLEVTASGFHRSLAEAVQDGGSFDEIALRFGGHLGGEAKALLQAMTYFAQRDADA